MGKNKKKKTVGKVQAVFQCNNENCKKTWSSIHAWTSNRFFCDFCDGDGKVVKYVDDMCKLDNYKCEPCNNFWQAIHGDGIIQHLACNICKRMIQKDKGTQTRHGRHYFYKCKNKKAGCGVEWEDFLPEGESIYSQRCTKCFSNAEMMGETKVPPGGDRRGGGRFGGNGGAHVKEFCDMCVKLAKDGVAGSCKKKNLVISEVVYHEDGVVSETILHALERRGGGGNDDSPDGDKPKKKRNRRKKKEATNAPIH